MINPVKKFPETAGCGLSTSFGFSEAAPTLNGTNDFVTSRLLAEDVEAVVEGAQHCNLNQYKLKFGVEK